MKCGELITKVNNRGWPPQHHRQRDVGRLPIAPTGNDMGSAGDLVPRAAECRPYDLRI